MKLAVSWRAIAWCIICGLYVFNDVAIATKDVSLGLGLSFALGVIYGRNVWVGPKEMERRQE